MKAFEELECIAMYTLYAQGKSLSVWGKLKSFGKSLVKLIVEYKPNYL